MKPNKRSSLRLALCLAAVAFLAGLDAPGAANYSDTIQSQNPIAYWRFNDSVTVPVIDSVANLGSLADLAQGSYSGATHPIGGILTTAGDSAVRVTGGQHVRVPWSVDINPAPEFSVEGWFRPAVAFTDGTLTCAISSVHFALPRAGWLIYQVAGGFNFRMYNQKAPFSVSITGGGPLVAGMWYHVVATYDGATATLYVNGVNVAQGNGTYVPAPDGDLTVGMRADNLHGWSGEADEVAVYGVPLASERVQAHYALALSHPAVGDYQQAVLADAPLGYWPLNEPVFVPPVALNAGSRGAELNGAYRGGATSLDQAPKAPDFIGFEEGNTALTLDGKDDYVSTLAGLLNPLSKFTISGWVRRAGDQATRSGIWGQNDIVEFGYINNSTIQALTDGGLDLTPNPFPNEQWSHLALVCDGPTISIYTNGVVAVKRNHSLPAANNFAFNIGGGGVFDAGGNFFNGQIDEVALFDKPLTAVDIWNQYAAAVTKAPEVVSVGEPVSIYSGSTVTLPVLACGSPTLTYQWYRLPEQVVVGATTAVLTLVNAQVTDSGDYFARVSNEYGSADSTPVTLTVLPPSLPVFITQPVPSTRYQGAGATFSVAAIGTPPFQYQWQRDSVNIEGATAAALTLDPVQSAQAGAYRVLVKNPVGELFSEAASLTVLVPAEGSYAAEVVKTRPVAFWRLGEGEGETAFDYVGGLNGTYVNVALGAPGGLADGLDTSADFNGGDSAVTTPASMNNFNAFTLTGWVRRAADQGTRRGLFGQHDLVEFGFIDNETIEGYINVDGSAMDITSPLANEQWGFVVLRGDASSLTVLLNGVEAGRIDVSLTGYGSSAYGFKIGGGGIFDATGNGFLGQIDEVALYNRALSSGEICGLYLTGSGLPFRVDVFPAFDSAPKGVTLTWPCGVLQQADGLGADGTTVWTDVVDALSPLSVRGEAAQRYYRVWR